MTNRNPYEFLELSDLPRLPVPPVAATLDRYLEHVRPLVDDVAFANTKRAVDDFISSGVAERLQHRLQERAKESSTSWLQKWWDASYLAGRCPNPVHINPFFVFNSSSLPEGQVPRAVAWTHAILQYYVALRQNKIEPDMERKTPLCLTQYWRLFATSRVPLPGKDAVYTHPSSAHFLVMRGGRIYVVPALVHTHDPAHTALAVSPARLTALLQSIIADDTAAAPNGCSPLDDDVARSVAILTSWRRDEWAAARQHLAQSSPENDANLRLVDEALFVLCLDAPEDEVHSTATGEHAVQGVSAGVGAGVCDRVKEVRTPAASLHDVSRSLLHGRRGRNRWFDKLQFIVQTDGVCGINMEHTAYDGHTVLSFATRLLRHLSGKHPLPVAPLDDRVHVSARCLRWDLDKHAHTQLLLAQRDFDFLITETDLAVIDWKQFGSGWIKKQKMSPDAFTQVAFQLAYFLMKGKPRSTYESCQVKQFYHGRTETIRSVTNESVAFCRAVVAGGEKHALDALLREAVSAQVNRAKMAKKGMGVDRHLYGLQLLAQEEQQGEHAQEMPSLFTDPSYTELVTSTLSTSHCGGEALDLFGFGPVVHHGLGIGYMILPDGIRVTVTSFTGLARTYARALLLSLSIMSRSSIASASL